MTTHSLKRLMKTITVAMTIGALTFTGLEVASAAPKPAAKGGSQAKGSLIIESSSNGAKVYVDGKEMGSIPFKPASLPVGKHKIEVKKMGFLSYSNDLVIQAGKGARITVDLVPVASVVNLASIPAKATVYIDGVEKGTTPTKIELKTGTYNVEFKLNGYLPFKKQVKITKLGQTVPVSATLAQDKLKDDEDDLMALPLELPGEDPLALDLEPLPDMPLEPATPPATAPAVDDDPLALDSLDLEPLPDEKPHTPLAPAPPLVEAKDQKDGSSDSHLILAVPATSGAVAGGMGANGTAEAKANNDNKWYKSWWFWTITGAVVVGTAVGVGVGVSQGNKNNQVHYDGYWTLGGGYTAAQH